MLIIDDVSEEELTLHKEKIIMGALSPELVDLRLAKAFNAHEVGARSAKEPSHA
jgi:hypothetical protein